MPFKIGIIDMDMRYSFTSQFLIGSAICAQRARDIEDSSQPIDERCQAEHRACVVSAIMQSVAAIESEISEIIKHGPGHHLGSNGIDQDARSFLVPLADVLDRCSSLERYELVLHLLRKPPMNRGTEPFQSTQVLVRLRNQLVHYQSPWSKDLERTTLITQLRQLRFEPPRFVHEASTFFPHKILCSSCAIWAVSTAKDFINNYHEHLQIRSPLSLCDARLVVPDIRRDQSSE